MSHDFDAHNEEVERVWEAFRAGAPVRPPMILGVNPRYTMGRPEANPDGITFAEYISNPEKMMQRQCEHIWWVRHNLPQDAAMGPPSDGFQVYVDFQNFYEAAWLGAEVFLGEGKVPDTLPLVTDDDRRGFLDRGIPDPFGDGLMATNWEFYDHMRRRMDEGYEFRGLPIAGVSPNGLGTDGPVTVCCNLRGATGFASDLASDPDYAARLLDFVTDAAILRIRAFRERMGQDPLSPGLGFADDSIQLLSVRMYEEQVLHCHRRLIAGLSQGGPNSIHLCGDATRHFPLIARELNVNQFDTGFPVDFAWLHANLPRDVAINGGPSVPFLCNAAPGEIRKEVRRILDTGIARGRPFVLREGNNLAPEVAPEACAEMYAAVREFGPGYV